MHSLCNSNAGSGCSHEVEQALDAGTVQEITGTSAHKAAPVLKPGPDANNESTWHLGVPFDTGASDRGEIQAYIQPENFMDGPAQRLKNAARKAPGGDHLERLPSRASSVAGGLAFGSLQCWLGFVRICELTSSGRAVQGIAVGEAISQTGMICGHCQLCEN